MRTEEEVCEKQVEGLNYTECYDRYSKKVKNICMRKLGGSAENAEDMMQDIFILLFSHLDEIKSEEHLRNWLSCVIRRCSINFYKKKYNQAMHDAVSLEDVILEDERNREDLQEDRELVREIRQYVHQKKKPLDEDILRYKMGEVALADLAVQYEMTKHAIECRASRLMKELQNRFRAEFEGN